MMGSQGTQVENSKNNTHQEGNVVVSPVTLVSKVLAYFSSI